MKLIIFVHTCKKYEEKRAKLIENTWGNTEDVVFITDNPDSVLKNHIYIGEYKQGHTYHPENVIKMFNLFIEKFNDYDFFMIVDDDSYVYIEKLKLYLSFFNKNDAYMIGDFLNWITKRIDHCKIHPEQMCGYWDSNSNWHNFDYEYNNWVSGGPGIVFTKECLITFLNLFKTINVQYLNHDVWLHNYFIQSDKKTIKRVDCPAFYQYNAVDLLKKYSKTDNNIISVHLEGNMDLLNEFHINK
jgi:hypothetical protein